MRSNPLRCGMMVTGISLLVSATGTVQADVLDFNNFKSRFFVQDSALPATEVVSYTAVQRLFGSDLTSENLGTATVTNEVTGTRALSPFGDFATVFGGPFFNEADLDAYLPAGEYRYEIVDGLFGPGSGTVFQPETNFWSSVPFFANWAALQNPTPGVDLFVDFDAAELAPETNSGGVFYVLVNEITFTTAAFGFIPFSDPTEFTLPADALLADTPYLLQIDFSARIDQGNGSDAFAGALGQVSFDTLTSTRFRTIPTPGALFALVLGGALVARRRRSEVNH